MVFAEASFPRGGTVKRTEVPSGDNASENIQFGAVTTSTKTKKEKPNKKEREELRAQAIEKKRKQKQQIEAVSAELLSFKSLKEGMCVMGCIKSVDATFLHVCLPGRINGRVPVTSISQSYLNIINKYVNDEAANDDENEADNDYRPLTDHFAIGQIVCAKVKKVDQTSPGNIVVELSLMPSDVQEDHRHNQMRKGMLLSVAIAEKDDHGYVIETGVKNLRGFLPFDKVPEPERERLLVGGLVFAKVDEVKTSTAASTVQLITANSPKNWTMKNFEEPNINYLLPSAIVNFKITKILKNGLQGSLFNEHFIGYINEHQLGIEEGKPFIQPKNFHVGEERKARILYVQPLTKLVYLTLNLQEKFIVNANEDTSTILPIGTILPDAKVSHVGTGGIILKLNGKLKGVISFRSIRVDVKSNFDSDEIMLKYTSESVHRVRIIHYDPIDLLHVCSIDTKVLKEKYFSLNDVELGDVVKVEIVRKVNDGRYEIKLGSIKGYAHSNYLSPTTPADKLQPSSHLKVRVIGKNVARNEVYVTNRKELLDKDAPLLTSFSKAKLQSSFMGMVRKQLKDGWIIEFCNQIHGMVYRSNLTTAERNTAEKLYVGQIMKFIIKYVTSAKKGQKIILGLSSCRVEPGLVLSGRVAAVQPAGLDISFMTKNTNGLVPIMYLSDYPSLVHAMHGSYRCNDSVTAIGLTQNFYSIRDVDNGKPGTVNIKPWGLVKVGDILPAFIKNVDGEVIDVQCFLSDQQKITRLHLKTFLENLNRAGDINLVPDQKIHVKVIGKNQVDKSLTCSAKLHDVWIDGDFGQTAAIFKQYFSDVAQIRHGLEMDKNPIVNFKVGGIVEGELCVDEEVAHSPTASSILTLEGGVKAVLTHSNSDIQISKRKKIEAKKHKMLIVWIDYAQQIVYGTMKAKYLDRLKGIHDEVAAPAELKERRGLKADILLILDDLIVLLPRKVTQKFIYVPRRLHHNDFQPILANGITEGAIANVTCISTEGEQFIAVFEHIYRLYEKFQIRIDIKPNAAVDKKPKANGEKKRKQTTEAVTSTNVDIEDAVPPAKKKKTKNAKKAQSNDVEEDSGIENTDTKKSPKNKKPMKKAKAAEQNKISTNDAVIDITESPAKNAKRKRKTSNIQPGFSLRLPQLDGALDLSSDEDSEPEVKVKKITKKPKQNASSQPNKKSVLPSISDFFTTDLSVLEQTDANNAAQSSSSEDDSDAEASRTKKSKLSAHERFQVVRAEEARLREIERSYADDDIIPTSVDQFDRLVMGEPNSSRIWIQYMVFHLQATEMDRARGVARKALKTINFREAQERLNIWISLLNLELRYGSKESFEDVLKEALQVNEPLQVYGACLRIFADCKRLIELSDCAQTVTRKFRANPECWIMAAQAFFEVKLAEKAKPLLTRALASLPERDHINTIVKFANLSNKFGQKDHAQALFEQILVSYPKRIDVWSQYVDLLVKGGDIDIARQTLDRAASQKIPMKKMRTIFKKYLEFEEKYGDEGEVKKVKELAASYVEQEINA